MAQIVLSLLFIVNNFGFKMVDPKPEVTLVAQEY